MIVVFVWLRRQVRPDAPVRCLEANANQCGEIGIMRDAPLRLDTEPLGVLDAAQRKVLHDSVVAADEAERKEFAQMSREPSRKFALELLFEKLDLLVSNCQHDAPKMATVAHAVNGGDGIA